MLADHRDGLSSSSFCLILDSSVGLSAGASSKANSFSIQHEILSGPEAFFWSSLASNLSTPVVVISRFTMGR